MPTFSKNTTAYATTTTDAYNTLMYTTEDAGSTVTVELNGVVETSSTLTWIPSSLNTVEITVVNGSDTTKYTINVTHS